MTINSTAAFNYAGERITITDRIWPFVKIEQELATAFDAGVAHERAQSKPRTISTTREREAAEELGLSLRDGQGLVYQCDELGYWRTPSILNGFPSAWFGWSDRAPLTLLGPASAPEPVHLTDPLDPRIKPGALVEWRTPFTLTDEAWPHDQGYWAKRVRDDLRNGKCSGTWLLLAEAPDPDADRAAKIREIILHADDLDSSVRQIVDLINDGALS